MWGDVGKYRGEVTARSHALAALRVSVRVRGRVGGMVRDRGRSHALAAVGAGMMVTSNSLTVTPSSERRQVKVPAFSIR